MRKDNKIELPKVNFYDGQKIKESDLDAEQLHKDSRISNIATDFHGSGILKKNPYAQNILLDTRYPDKYSSSDYTNPSKSDIDEGRFDGKIIKLDRQPSDIEFGNRLIFSLFDSKSYGRKLTSVMVVGRTFDGSSDGGILDYEILEFDGNESKITSRYFISIIDVIFNNFSGGTGYSVSGGLTDSANLIGDNGYMIISESEPMSVFAAPKSNHQTLSPNNALNNFIFETLTDSTINEDSLGLGSSDVLSDLYIELNGLTSASLDKNASTAILYGQKFLATSNNIQKINLLMSLDEDSSFSGDIVLSINKLSNSITCKTDVAPDDEIDYDPEITPIIEISFSQSDLYDIGIVLSTVPTVVPFDFSDTLIANPNIEPTLEVGQYYSFSIKRVGDTRVGKISIKKGYSVKSGKSEFGSQLYLEEQFSKTTSKFFEFDPATSRYINSGLESLWFEIYSASVEVTDGISYSDDGFSISIPKTKNFVGDNLVSNYYRNIDLVDTSYYGLNYITVNHIQKFSNVESHPITGNLVFTRINDLAQISAISKDELDTFVSINEIPLILASVSNTNVSSGSEISGTFIYAGNLKQNYINIYYPSNELLDTNLIGRIFSPDKNCACDDNYIIVNVETSDIISGDLNNDGAISILDLNDIASIAGNTINSSITEKKILNGDILLSDFLKSDLNNDGTVDGIDIGLLEDAIDGNINFTIPQKFKVTRLYLENIDNSLDYPLIADGLSATSTNGDGTVLITFLTYKDAFASNVGDNINILSGIDSGIYTISRKELDFDTLQCIFTVTDAYGNEIIFIGDSLQSCSIISGTSANMFARNKDLLTVPYNELLYSINFNRANFRGRFINVCDLRRFVNTSFIEEVIKISDSCNPAEPCSPIYKNQQYIDGDLYIKNGNIFTEPGKPHPGDFEFVNIELPLPSGSIDGCSIDLYNNFIKAESNSCYTASGYKALKYSDGSYVGMEDVGADTDIIKGRVKFSNSISGLYVDSYTGGDGYLTCSATNDSLLNRFFEEEDYSEFISGAWAEDSGNDTAPIITITNPPSGPISLEITTSNDSERIYRQLSTTSSYTGDFIIDIVSSRVQWAESQLTSGVIKCGTSIDILNDDGSYSLIKLGWKITGGGVTKFFFSGITKDSLNSVLDSYSSEVDATDDITDNIQFKITRVDDVIQGFYYNKNSINVDSVNLIGIYNRVGLNPDVQPGSGSANINIFLEQETSPDVNKTFEFNVSHLNVKYDVSSINSFAEEDTLYISNNSGSSHVVTSLPINIPSNSVVISAELVLKSRQSGTLSANHIIVIPYNAVDVPIVTPVTNIAEELDDAYFVDFSPGVIIDGGDITIDILSIVEYYLSNESHLIGFQKALLIKTEDSTSFSLAIYPSMTLNIVYEDSTGVIFKIGVSIDADTGVATINTRNILYDSLISENRTTLNFGVYLKKSSFKNSDLKLTINDVSKLGIGNCTSI